MSGARQILLVEDSRADVEMTLEALATHNLANEVVVAEDGAAALDFLERRGPYAGRPPGNPVVVLLDLKLPKVDGLEVLRAIRADENLSLIPVVMLTSSAEERDRVQSYRLGANAYVVKPVNFGDFASAVASVGIFWAAVNEPPPYCQP